MALKALLIKKRLDNARRDLAALREKDAGFETRRAELTTAIDEVETEEQRSAVEELVNAFEAEETEHKNAIDKLEREIEGLEADLKAEEDAQDTTPPPEHAPANDERKDDKKMAVTTRNRAFARMSYQEREAFVARQDVKDYLAETRNAIREKRALTNVGITIPQVMMGLLRENVMDYSKLYRHVAVRRINGEGRLVIMGTVPEAIWTDCCANLNELSLAFADFEADCYKVGGYYAVCNANLEDSDIDLAAELLEALGQAIGLALDKAILFGQNASGAMKMPLGVLSRLAQTAQPSGYPATARPWVDLHTTNIITVGTAQAPLSGAELISAIVNASGAAKGKYSRGEKVWVMSETTYTALMAATVSVDAAGRIVSGVSDVMPVVGGIIEVLSFVPNGVIIGGYFDLYVLAERGGTRFATSEHVRFLQDQTVFKGTARYDGGPAIAEAFVAIGLNGATPDPTDVTFASDTANANG